MAGEAKRARRTLRPEGELGHSVANALIDDLAVAGALIDQNSDVLHFYGRTGDYLELAQGEPTRNVVRMARPALRRPLHDIIAAAKRARDPTGYQVRVALAGDEDVSVLLEVVPVEQLEAGPLRHFLLL